MIVYDMIWYNKMWYDSTWYDKMRYGTIWYNMVWYRYDNIWEDKLNFQCDGSEHFITAMEETFEIQG